MGRTGRDEVPDPAALGMGFRTLGVPVRGEGRGARGEGRRGRGAAARCGADGGPAPRWAVRSWRRWDGAPVRPGSPRSPALAGVQGPLAAVHLTFLGDARLLGAVGLSRRNSCRNPPCSRPEAVGAPIRSGKRTENEGGGREWTGVSGTGALPTRFSLRRPYFVRLSSTNGRVAPTASRTCAWKARTSERLKRFTGSPS